jgi:hypothetical protein
MRLDIAKPPVQARIPFWRDTILVALLRFDICLREGLEISLRLGVDGAAQRAVVIFRNIVFHLDVTVQRFGVCPSACGDFHVDIRCRGSEMLTERHFGVWIDSRYLLPLVGERLQELCAIRSVVAVPSLGKERRNGLVYLEDEEVKAASMGARCRDLLTSASGAPRRRPGERSRVCVHPDFALAEVLRQSLTQAFAGQGPDETSVDAVWSPEDVSRTSKSFMRFPTAPGTFLLSHSSFMTIISASKPNNAWVSPTDLRNFRMTASHCL